LLPCPVIQLKNPSKFTLDHDAVAQTQTHDTTVQIVGHQGVTRYNQQHRKQRLSLRRVVNR